MTKRAALSTAAEALRAAMTAHASARYIMRKICEEHLEGRYDLDVVDIAQHPELAAGEQIIAAPTLVKISPLPVRRFIGDMSRTDRILLGLDLHPAPAMASPATRI